MNIQSQLVGQILRFVLRAGAAYLAAIGVGAEDQSELVDVLVRVFTPIILVGIAEVWSAVNKRNLFNLDPKAAKSSSDVPSSPIAGLIAIVALSAVVLAGTGCPSSKKVAREGREASAKISIYGKKVIQANIDSYKSGEISLEQFRQLNAVTGKFVEGVRVYRQALDAAEGAIAAGETKGSVLAKLQSIFQHQVVSRFLELGNVLKLIPGAHNEHVRTIIAAIEIGISTVSVMFGRLEGELRAMEARA